MTTLPDIFIEMDIYAALTDPDSAVISDPDGDPINVLSGWGDVTEDVRHSVPIIYTAGNPGHSIEDRVADEGILTLGFDNSEQNSGGVAGYYSPDSGNCRTEFVQDAPIRIRMTLGGTSYYQWQGVITNIFPDSGIYGRRITEVMAVDYIHYLTETDFVNVSVQSGKRDNELLTTLLTGLPIQPLATDFDTGDDVYTYAFQDEITGTSKLATVIQKLMMSGLGKFFIRGGTTIGETLRYVNRSNAIRSATPVAVIDDEAVDVRVSRDDTSRIRKIIAITHPTQVSTSDEVLWQLNEEISLTASQTLTFTMYLRDPSARATRVAALSTVAPVADTDYKFSSVSGSGNDLNASVTFSYSAGADAIDVTITNNAAVTGYLWFFKPRGKAIYLYEPTVKSELTGQSAGRNITIDMIYQDDVFVGADIASIVADWYAVPRSNVDGVRILANRSDQLMLDALTAECGDLVNIKETQTGMDASFIVNGITKEIHLGGKIIYATWNLVQAQILDAFILDVDALDVGILGV